jgi:ATP adenylyltransferase
MVVPYQHEPNLDCLDAQTLTEMMTLTQLSLQVLRAAYSPEGFNIGMNIGEASGAGIVDHAHLHVVPRWAGDTNYMTTVAKTRTIPEWMDETYERLRPLFEALSEEGAGEG